MWRSTPVEVIPPELHIPVFHYRIADSRNTHLSLSEISWPSGSLVWNPIWIHLHLNSRHPATREATNRERRGRCRQANEGRKEQEGYVAGVRQPIKNEVGRTITGRLIRFVRRNPLNIKQEETNWVTQPMKTYQQSDGRGTSHLLRLTTAGLWVWLKYQPH